MANGNMPMTTVRIMNTPLVKFGTSIAHIEGVEEQAIAI